MVLKGFEAVRRASLLFFFPPSFVPETWFKTKNQSNILAEAPFHIQTIKKTWRLARFDVERSMPNSAAVPWISVREELREKENQECFFGEKRSETGVETG